MYLGKLNDEKLVKQLIEDYKSNSIKELMIKYNLKRHEVVKITRNNNVNKRIDFWTKDELELASSGIIPEGRTKKSMITARQRNNLGLKGGKRKWTKQEETYLKNNWKLKTDKEIAKYLKRFPGSVKNKRIQLNLKNEFKWSNVEKDILLDCSTLLECEERLSNRTLYSIKHMINKLGIKFKDKRFSYPHQLVCKQLMKLGIQYITEYKIYTYSIDCYLPSIKLCIEVNGSYWHSLKTKIISDKEKYKYLKANNYELLIITENDTKNINLVINKIIKKVVNCWEAQTYNDVGNQQPSLESNFFEGSTTK